jgi:hypothetical protein
MILVTRAEPGQSSGRHPTHELRQASLPVTNPGEEPLVCRRRLGCE